MIVPRAARRCAPSHLPAGLLLCSGIPFDRPVIGYGGKTINRSAVGCEYAGTILIFSNSVEAILWGRWQKRSRANR